MIAKNVADWTRETFFTVMDKTAVEVFSIAMLIQEQVKYELSKQGKI